MTWKMPRGNVFVSCILHTKLTKMCKIQIFMHVTVCPTLVFVICIFSYQCTGTNMSVLPSLTLWLCLVVVSVSRWGQGSRVGSHCVQDKLHLLSHVQECQSGRSVHGSGQRSRPGWLAGDWTGQISIMAPRHTEVFLGIVNIRSCPEILRQWPPVLNRRHVPGTKPNTNQDHIWLMSDWSEAVPKWFEK